MARKVIVCKFTLFTLKSRGFARLFAEIACVNVVFPPQKLNSNETLQLDMRRFNVAFPHWIPSVSGVQFTVQMYKLNGLGKTHRKRICGRPENFARPFTTNRNLEWSTNCLREFRY